MNRALVLAFLTGLSVLGCSSHPVDPVATPWETFGTWPDGLKAQLGVRDGRWHWTWTDGAGTSGPADLVSTGERYRWRLVAAGGERPLELVPADPTWLAIRVETAVELAAAPPLPRLPVDSPAYPDLVAMLRDLLTPRFGGVVPRWHDRPVPVGSPPAQSGEIDLAACLREAVDIWNASEPETLFVWRPDADWGIHLAHYRGSSRRPPLATQLTRRDAAGRPLRLRITVGDDYQSAAVRPYLLRGLAHKLGHGLLLWGHTPDRGHLLWGEAPPLRADPSADERRAVRLLQCLPEGLDLARYGCDASPDRTTSRHGSSASGRPSRSGATSASPAR